MVILWYLKNNLILKMGKNFLGKNYKKHYNKNILFLCFNIITHQKISIYYIYICDINSRVYI